MQAKKPVTLHFRPEAQQQLSTRNELTLRQGSSLDPLPSMSAVWGHSLAHLKLKRA